MIESKSTPQKSKSGIANVDGGFYPKQKHIRVEI